MPFDFDLIEACKSGLRSQALNAMNSGASPSTLDVKGLGAIHYASMGGHAAIVGMMVGRWPSIVDLMDSAGNTPLHYACRSSSLDVVKVLVARDADMGALNRDGLRPMELCTNTVIFNWVRSIDESDGAHPPRLHDVSHLNASAPEPALHMSLRLNPKAPEPDLDFPRRG